MLIHPKSSLPKWKWLNFISSNRYDISFPGEKLQLDMSDCGFYEPIHLVTLACLIEEYFDAGIEIEFVNLDRCGIIDYLNNVHFLQYWTDGFDRNAYIPSSTNTTFSLWRVSEDMINDYATQAKNYFENNHLTDKELDVMHIALTELFNNIMNHSDSSINGYTVCQYFPNRGKLSLVVCDFGIGIPTVINDYLTNIGAEPLIDSLAIQKALERGFTTKPHGQNKGFGLDNIHTSVQSNNGTVLICSNNGYYKYDGAPRPWLSPKFSFSGTCIEVNLITSNFVDKSEQQIESDFFF